MSTLNVSPPPDPALFSHSDELRRYISPINAKKKEGPVPTNKWWGNILSYNGQGNLDPVYSSPYAIFIDKKTITCSYLHENIHHGPINVNGAISYYFFPQLKHLTFHCGGENNQFEVEDWDDLTVQIALKTDQQSLRSTLAIGQAFITMKHENIPICISSETGIESIDGKPVGSSDTCAVIKAFQQQNYGHIIVGLKNNQQWALFWSSQSSVDVEFVYDHASKSIRSTSNFCGIVQAAILATPQDFSHYEKFAGSFITGGNVVCDDVHSFEFQWTLGHTRSENQLGLHFSMEHQKEILTFGDRVVPLALHSHTRGSMQAFSIDPSSPKWRFEFSAAVDQELSRFTQLDPPRSPSHEDIQKYHVVEHLVEEIQSPWVLPESYYFKGKALQKYGSLCILANQLKNLQVHHASYDIGDQAAIALKKFQDLLDSVGANKSMFPLVYDTVYKGIVSSEAFHKHNINVEFGNAVYNDHHYHYGYFITAVAMAYHLDPGYMDRNPDLFKWISTLVRDVCNVNPEDNWFPKIRHFEFMLGHSYSHGVTCMTDGKDEESTSEEINCFYGCHLFALATKNMRLLKYSRILLKLASLAHRTYFFILNCNNTHPKEFLPNKVTGILFDNKCDYTTWFSPNRECIHGIQMLPVSPILEYSRPLQFIKEEWQDVLSKVNVSPSNAWISLLMTNYSALDAQKACQVLETCCMDDGLSRAYALYFALTRASPTCSSLEMVIDYEDDGWLLI